MQNDSSVNTYDISTVPYTLLIHMYQVFFNFAFYLSLRFRFMPRPSGRTKCFWSRQKIFS